MSTIHRLSRLASRIALQQRLATLVTAVDKEEKKRLEDNFKKQYKDYKSRHPDTDKSEADYVAEQWERHNKRDRDDSGDEDGADKPDGAGKPDDTGDGDEVKDPDDKEELDDMDIDMDISKQKLVDALKALMDEDNEPTDIAGSLEGVAEKLVEVVDFDDYVMNMPNEAKQLATHLKGKQEKAEGHANTSMGAGASYKDYAKAARESGETVISEKRWKALQRKAQKKAEDELKKQISKGDDLPATYKDYVDDKRKSGEVPVTQTTWKALTKGKK